MTSLNEYYNEIRMDIAKDFGFEAGGYSPRPSNVLPVDIALRIAKKYPSEQRFVPNLKAVVIAQRYFSLMMKGGK